MESMYIGKENFLDMDEMMKKEDELLKKYPDDWGIKMMHDQWKDLRREFLNELERRVREESDDFARETLAWYHEYYGS
jgi:flagellar motor component MotA